MILSTGGRILQEGARINELDIIQVTLRICGGKGGYILKNSSSLCSYGNILKKQAKKTNPNATLDFSACRDLNGRRYCIFFLTISRMRFVNATVAMQKWKERLDRLEELKAENPNATLYLL